MRRSGYRIALAALPAVLAGMFAAPSAPAATPPAPVPRPVTPILSARRVAGWVDGTIAHRRLAQQLESITAGRMGGPGQATGCVVVNQAGAAVFALNPQTELIPASNLKLVTATAALDILGPGHHATTTVAAAGPARRGVISGNLYLIGGGDPYLMTAAHDSALYYPEPVYTSLDGLAAAVKAAGVTTVTGSVVGDASRYDSLIGVGTWEPWYLTEGDVGPLSALEINDGAPPDGAATPSRPASADPTLYAAQEFTELLKARGVRVAGPAATGPAPAAAVTVTSVNSAPLSAQVGQMLRVSDDTAAELFTKEIGLKVSGHGTTSAGTAAIRRAVAQAGLPAAQLVALDGSGLDRGDRATCGLIVATLERSGITGAVAAGLPVAGRTGTLKDRMAGTVAVGRLHAKTGTLNQVSALSGYVDPRPGAPTPRLGEPVYFSVIINGMDSDLAAPLADRIGVAVAAYPDAPPLSRLEPRK